MGPTLLRLISLLLCKWESVGHLWNSRSAIEIVLGIYQTWDKEEDEKKNGTTSERVRGFRV
jgi:hypothetical protein